MKKRLKITIFAMLIISIIAGCSNNNSGEKTPSDDDNTLTVGTYNIDAKEVGDHNKQRKLMDKNNVDVFGIQEVNYKNKRFADEDIESYNPIPEFQKNPYAYSYYGNAIDFAGGGYGIATISSLSMTDENTKNLIISDSAKKYAAEFEAIYRAYDPTKPDTVKAMDDMSEKNGIESKGAMEPRIYTRVVIEKNGQKVAFYNTHLSFENTDIRKRQMQQLQSDMKNDPIQYTIAVGDFNADQSTKEFDLWRKDFNIANGDRGIWRDTFIGTDDAMNVNSIDNIIVSKNIKIKNLKREQSELSDHLPLIADLELN